MLAQKEQTNIHQTRATATLRTEMLTPAKTVRGHCSPYLEVVPPALPSIRSLSPTATTKQNVQPKTITSTLLQSPARLKTYSHFITFILIGVTLSILSHDAFRAKKKTNKQIKTLRRLRRDERRVHHHHHHHHQPTFQQQKKIFQQTKRGRRKMKKEKKNENNIYVYIY